MFLLTSSLASDCYSVQVALSFDLGLITISVTFQSRIGVDQNPLLQY